MDNQSTSIIDYQLQKHR